MKIAVSLILTGVFTCVSGCYPLCPNGCFVYVGDIKATPILQMWKKDDVTSLERRSDARACGSTLKDGVSEPDNTAFFKDGKVPGQRSDEDEWAAHDRVEKEWEQCMLGKGYRFELPSDGR